MSASAQFNETFYLTNNADVVVAISQGVFGSALQHYNLFGGKELRAPNSTFDASYYAVNNPDVLNAVASGVFANVFEHFKAFGESENRAPTSAFASFDAAGYLAANADVAAAVTAGSFSSALDHFISFGQTEARTGSGVTEGTNTGTAGDSFSLTNGTDLAGGSSASNSGLASTFRFSANNETVTAGLGTLATADTLLDSTTTDFDVLNATLTGASGQFTAQNIETINGTMSAGTPILELDNVSGINNVGVSGTVAGQVDGFNAQVSQPTISLNGYTNTLTVLPTTFAGTSAAGTAETLNLAVSGATFGSSAATRTTITIDGTGGAGTAETVNIASNGDAANTFALGTANAATLGTVNITGAQDATARVTHGDITGVTVAAGTNTGNTTLLIDRNGNGTTATNLANVSGVDTITFRDSTAGTDSLVASGVADGANLASTSVFTATTLTVTGAAGNSANTINLGLDHSSANTAVTLGTLTAQNVETLAIASNGFSSATIGTGNSATLAGDYTAVNISGDTAFTIGSSNIDAPSSGTRTTTVDASGLTGTATLQASFAGDTDTTNVFNVTGTANADNITGGAGADTISGGAGNDTLTGGLGNDTITGGAGNDEMDIGTGTDTYTGGDGNDNYDFDSTGIAAVPKVTLAENLNTVVTLAANDQIIATVNGVQYATTFITNATTTIAKFDSDHSAALLAQGLTLADIDTSTDLQITGAADGTDFTVNFSIFDNSAGTNVDVTDQTSTAAVVASDVAATITDFSTTDTFNTTGLTALGTGGYYEGAAATSTAGTAYGVMVINDQGYASADAAEDAVATRNTSGTDDVIIVFLNQSTGVAEAFFDADIAADDAIAATASIATYTNITTLQGITDTFSSDSFVI